MDYFISVLSFSYRIFRNIISDLHSLTILWDKCLLKNNSSCIIIFRLNFKQPTIWFYIKNSKVGKMLFPTALIMNGIWRTSPQIIYCKCKFKWVVHVHLTGSNNMFWKWFKTRLGTFFIILTPLVHIETHYNPIRVIRFAFTLFKYFPKLSGHLWANILTGNTCHFNCLVFYLIATI